MKFDNLSYEEIEKEINGELIQFGSHEIRAWERFKELYEQIPKKYKLKILMNCIYSHYTFDPNELSEYIYDYLYDSELILEEDQKDFLELKQKLHELNLIDSDGYVTLYRGYTEESEDNDVALSWTYNRDDALFFALRKNEYYKDFKTGKYVTPYLTEIKVTPDYILFIMDDDREHEIVLDPEADKIIVSDKEVDMSETDIAEFFRLRKEKQERQLEEMTREFQEKNKII